MYATDPHIAELGSIREWAGVFPIFHWSLIPWGFYLVLAVAFGFMLHVRNRERQKYSEACRPILGKHTDGMLGRIIDLLAVFALIAGTATTFSIATPLMASIINELFHIELSRTVVTYNYFNHMCYLYLFFCYMDSKELVFSCESLCIPVLWTFIVCITFGGETKFIIENGFASLGKVVSKFL